MRLIFGLIACLPALLYGQILLPSEVGKVPHDDTLGYQAKVFSLLMGYQYNPGGLHFATGELAWYTYGVAGHHGFGMGSTIGVEIGMNDLTHWRYAPKASVWLGGGVTPFLLGGSILRYQQGETHSWILRPEISLNILNIRLYYGQALALGQGSLLGMQKHLWGLGYFFNIRKKQSWMVHQDEP